MITNTKKTNSYILGISAETLNEAAENTPGFRLKQIYNWMFKNYVFSPSEMKNLPASLQKKLSEAFIWEHPKIVERKQTSDKTEKYLLELKDGEHIEFVIIKTPERNTLCLSSQVGCPIQCRFCASGVYGLKRNLSDEEILYQFLFTSKILGKFPDNVVFMGIGEPLLNLNNLTSALDKMCSPEFLNYAARRITISTSGIPKKIKELANLGKQWNLAVSIHAPDDKIRSLLIPDKSRFPLKEIFDACKYYFDKTGRIITFEYTLIDGINDKKIHAEKLAGIAKNIRAKVNLIPYNPVPGTNFKRPDNSTCINFAKILESKSITCMLRIEKGSKINAACGQLRISKKTE